MTDERSRWQRWWMAWWRDERGTTMLESSIIFGMLVVLLFGAIDWSRFYYNRARIRSAVRRGALYAARLPSDVIDSATVAAYTRAALIGSATEQALGTVDVQFTGGLGDDPRVQVAWLSYPFTRASALVMKTARQDTVRAEFRQETP